MYTCVHTGVSLYLALYIYIYVYIHAYIYKYIHICIYIDILSEDLLQPDHPGDVADRRPSAAAASVCCRADGAP